MASGRRHDPETTKTAIVDAAEALFVTRGFASVAISEIAKKSGVTKSLIHHYFGSKDELYREVQRRGLEQYFVRQLSLIRDPSLGGEGTLRASVEAFFRFHQGNPGVSRIMGWAELEGLKHPLTDLEQAVTREGIERIRRDQEKGVLRDDIEPEHVLATFLMLASRWFMFKDKVLEWARRDVDDPDADDRYLSDMLKIFFEGVVKR
ncbi:MAG: TetR/AcrR family transcriptional regulator [Myxococcota bacterium]